MLKADQNTFIKISLVMLSLLSLAFFLVLFSSVRCEPDDMIIGLECRDGSFYQTLMNRYYTHTFRPAYTLFAYLTIGFTNDTSMYNVTIFMFYFLLYVFFVWIIYKLLIEIFSLKNMDRKDKLLLACFSVLQVTCIYFLTTERIEIFGWLSASIIHLLPVVFIFFSAWLIMKQDHRKTDYLFLFISAVIIAGSAEHLAASATACVIAILLFNRIRTKEFVKKENKLFLTKTLFFVILLSVFLMLFISNPGVKVRLAISQSFIAEDPVQYSLRFTETCRVFFKPYKLFSLLFMLCGWGLFKRVFREESNKIFSSTCFIFSLG